MINRYSNISALLFLLIALFLSKATYSHETIKIGVLVIQGESELLIKAQKTADFLNREIPNHKFEIVQITIDKLKTSVNNKEVDLLICNPSSFILIKELYGGVAIATMERYFKGVAYNSYGRVFFTLKENTSINNIYDLKGKVVAVVDRVSMGGGLLTTELLQKNNLTLQSDPKTLILTPNFEDVIQSVLSKQADIGIIRSGILEEKAEKGEIELEAIKVIRAQTHSKYPFLVSTDLIPEWPFVKLTHFSDSIASDIAQILFAFNILNEQITSGSNFGWTFPADYTIVIDKLKSIQAPPFENIEPSFKESLIHDWYYFFLIFSLVIVLVLFILFARYVLTQLNLTKNKDFQITLKRKYEANDSGFLSGRKCFATECAQKKYELRSIRSWKYLGWLLSISTFYYLVVNFGLLFSIDNSGNTAIWFAAGFSFLAVYSLGYRIWPAILLGAFFVNISPMELFNIHLIGFDQFLLAIINGLNNALSAVLGVFLMRKFFGTKQLFSTIRSTVSFIFMVALLVSLISAIIGTLTFALFSSHGHFYAMLLTWWLSDAAGLVLIVPLVLSWKKPEYSTSKIKQFGLLISFMLLLVFVGFFIFQIGYHIAYLFLPFFIYFTYRFGRFLSLIMAFILSLVSVWVVIYLNIYWFWNTPAEGLFYVRLFLLILIFTILLLAAVLDEQFNSEERMRLYKKIIDSSNDGIAIFDTNGFYLEQNPAHEKLMGYTDDELEGKTPAIHLGQDVFDSITKELADNKLSIGERISNTKNGQKPIDLSAFSISNDENEVICHVEIKRDISERKHNESLLKKSEAEAWSLFEHAAIPIMIEDFSDIKNYIDKLIAAGLTDWEAYFDQNPKEVRKLANMIKVVDVNKCMIDFYGNGSREQLFNNIASFFSDESLLVFREEIIALAQGKHTFTSEIPIMSLNGEVLHLMLNVSIPPLYGEKFERVLASFVDITKNKRVEKIQQTLLNISNAANKAKDIEEIIWSVQKELSKIIDTSNFFLALYNSEKDELSLPYTRDKNKLPRKLAASKTLTSIVIKNQKSLLLSEQDIQKLTKRGEIEQYEPIAKIWLGVPLKIKGEVIGAFVVQSYTNALAYSQNDIETLEIISNQIGLTIERKRAEDEVLLAFEKAQESDRIKSAFLASMSHELRTPLNAIIGFSNLINNEMPTEQVIQFTEMINKSGINLLKIVDSIFEVTLISEGNQMIVNRLHSFNDLMNDVNQTILTRKQVLNKTGVSIIISHNCKPEKEIFVDREKFKHIFLHLLNNALKFTPSGTITYGLDKIDEKGVSYFYVADTGIGIPKDKQELIFERFRMADDTHNRQFEGMGIGLFICKKLIESFGGAINVESEENIGSRFSFYLPLQTLK